MRKRSKRGFTLIELLIVIAIIGILAAVLIPNLLRARQVAQDRAGQAYLRNVYTAGQAYLAEVIEATTVPNPDCDTATGYAAGSFTVEVWGPMTDCVITADGTAVSGTWTGGVLNSGSIP